MKITAEKLPDSQVILNIEVDEEEVERSVQQTYKRLVQRVKIPGFRPGKAPRVVLQSFIGKDVLLDEALDELAPTVVTKAIEEQELNALDNPEVEVVEKNPVKLKATVSLEPTIELGDYKSIRLQKEEGEVSPEQVENALEELRIRQAPWQPSEGPVKLGDLVTLDVEGKVDGKTVIEENGVSYNPTAGSPEPVPGFSEQLENMTSGEPKEFTLTMPDDYSDQDLIGKDCLFKVTIHEIKEKNLPPLDDDFAKSLGDEYEDLESLRSKVREDMETHAGHEADRKYEDSLVEALKNGASIQAPPVLREREIDHIIMDEARALAARGVRFDNYLKAIGKTADELRENFKEVADKRVTTTLLLNKLGEDEGITVEEKEVQQEVREMVEAAGERGPDVREQLLKEEARSSIRRSMLMEKSLEALKAIAQSDEPASSTEEVAETATEVKGEEPDAS